MIEDAKIEVTGEEYNGIGAAPAEHSPGNDDQDRQLKSPDYRSSFGFGYGFSPGPGGFPGLGMPNPGCFPGANPSPDGPFNAPGTSPVPKSYEDWKKMQEETMHKLRNEPAGFGFGNYNYSLNILTLGTIFGKLSYQFDNMPADIQDSIDYLYEIKRLVNEIKVFFIPNDDKNNKNDEAASINSGIKSFGNFDKLYFIGESIGKLEYFIEKLNKAVVKETSTSRNQSEKEKIAIKYDIAISLEKFISAIKLCCGILPMTGMMDGSSIIW
jgi:hypothetical protein